MKPKQSPGRQARAWCVSY